MTGEVTHSPMVTRSITALAWVALAVVGMLVQGLPGHRVPFFTGDLAFHLATAHTMQSGGLNGSAPYLGVPSYYGGAFVLILGLVGRIGLDPDSALTVVSWAEPVLWVAAAASLARAMWPARVIAQLSFATLLCWAAGAGLGLTEQWVNAPNIAGQVFWPLFPRDVALLLLLVAVGAAVSARWLVAGVLAALSICFQAQVGMFAVASCGLALMVVSPRHVWVKRVGGLVVLAVVGSSWWWLPRVVWSARFGLALADNPHRVNLVPGPLTLWKAHAALLPLVALGAGHPLVVRSAALSPAKRFRLWWAAATILVLAVAAVNPHGLLTMRRALVLTTIPLTALAVDGLLAVADLLRRPQWAGAAVSVAVVVTVVAVSVPVLGKTHDLALKHWERARYGMLAYPSAQWSPVWTQVATDKTPLLAAPSDAAMAFFRTGRPVLYAPRPTYLKLGFDAGRVTGWGERARREAVTSAFMSGPDSLCELAKARGADSVLLRARSGHLGVVDFSAGTALTSGLTSPGVSTGDRDDVVVAVVPPGESVDLGPTRAVDASSISVWQAAGSSKVTFSVAVDRHRRRPIRVEKDGATQRLDFARPSGRGAISLVNSTGRPLWLIRVVAYTPWAGADAPATLVSRDELCRDAR